MVAAVGLEPTWILLPRFLRPLRMPFRHAATLPQEGFAAIGSRTLIRTVIHGFKVRCPAVGRYGNIYGMCVYIVLLPSLIA